MVLQMVPTKQAVLQIHRTDDIWSNMCIISLSHTTLPKKHSTLQASSVHVCPSKHLMMHINTIHTNFCETHYKHHTSEHLPTWYMCVSCIQKYQHSTNTVYQNLICSRYSTFNIISFGKWKITWWPYLIFSYDS